MGRNRIKSSRGVLYCVSPNDHAPWLFRFQPMAFRSEDAKVGGTSGAAEALVAKNFSHARRFTSLGIIIYIYIYVLTGAD